MSQKLLPNVMQCAAVAYDGGSEIIGSGDSPNLCRTMPNTSAVPGATGPQPKRMDTPVIAYPYHFLCQVNGTAFRALVCATTEKRALRLLKERVPTNQRARVYRIAKDEFLSDPILVTIGEPQMEKDHRRAALPAQRVSLSRVTVC